MKDESDTLIQENRIKTCRWLFYGSAFQVLVFFAVPIIIYPADMIISMAIRMLHWQAVKNLMRVFSSRYI